MYSALRSTMKSAYISSTGGPEAIRIGPLPVPQPHPGEVLVEVEQVTVNRIDTYVRAGTFSTSLPMPFILGRDMLGTVTWASQTSEFSAGDRVFTTSMGYDGRQGVSSTFASIPEDRLYRVGDADPEQVVALAHPASAAFLGLFVHAGLRPGDTVVLGGAAGNIGAAALEFAAHAGAHVIGLCSAADAPRVKTLGAEHVVDYRAPDKIDQIVDATRRPDRPEGGADIIWDTPGLNDMDMIKRIAALRARVIVTAASEDSVTVPVRNQYFNDVQLVGWAMSHAFTHDLAAAARAVVAGVQRDFLHAHISERRSLDDIADVHARMARGEIRGRVLLDLRHK